MRNAIRQAAKDATALVRFPSLRPKFWPVPPPPEVTQAIIEGSSVKRPWIDWEKLLAKLRTTVVPREVEDAMSSINKARAELRRMELSAKQKVGNLGLVVRKEALKDITSAVVYTVPTTMMGVVLIPVGQPYDTVQEHILEMFYWDSIDRSYF